MSHPARHADDEAQIAALLEAYTGAIHAKDAPATVALYARDVVAFDLAPPLRIDAAVERDPRNIQQWFDTWDGPIGLESRDRTIVVDQHSAYAFSLQHMTGTKTDGERVDLWFRATACFRREDGAWRIAHVHNSVPFAMDGSGRALLDLNP
jgi:ketosteroid isomerase-like protein